MIKFPLTSEQVERYRHLSGKSNLQLQVEIDFGCGAGTKELAERLLSTAISFDGVRLAKVHVEQRTFGLRKAAILTLEGKASGVAPAVLAMHDGYEKVQDIIKGAP
jgi:hypothetical protein